MVELSLGVNGIDQLSKSLQALGPELAKKALNDALKAGALPIAQEMQDRAPREDDIGPRQKKDIHLADSITISVEKNPVGSAAEVYVGPSKSVTHKARWIELGVAVHAIALKMTRKMRKAGIKAKQVLTDGQGTFFGTHVNHPGFRPKPFMRPALDTRAKDAIEAARQSLVEGVAAAARKVNKTPGK
jgi:HK97 gp10 family phage protein